MVDVTSDERILVLQWTGWNFVNTSAADNAHADRIVESNGYVYFLYILNIVYPNICSSDTDS